MSKSQQGEAECTVDWSRLQAICLRQGWDMGQLARAAGVSRTTLYHWQTGRTERPRGSTLFKLAEVLRVDPNELLVGGETLTSAATPANDWGERPRPGLPARVLASPGKVEAAPLAGGSVEEVLFDRQSNWCVQELCEQSPELFSDWTEQEWEELFSSFGVGGELNEEGVRRQVEAINQRRSTLYEVQVLLETHLADAARRVIHSLYESVQCPDSANPIPPAGNNNMANNNKHGA